MGAYSIWHWLIYPFLLLLIWFFTKVAKKAGYSPWWALLSAVPLVNLVLLWIFAYAKWPALPER